MCSDLLIFLVTSERGDALHLPQPEARVRRVLSATGNKIGGWSQRLAEINAEKPRRLECDTRGRRIDGTSCTWSARRAPAFCQQSVSEKRFEPFRLSSRFISGFITKTSPQLSSRIAQH